MQPFESPFFGMTDYEVRTWFNEHRHLNFACGTFAVVNNTAKNMTCRIGYTEIDAEERNKMITIEYL